MCSYVFDIYSKINFKGIYIDNCTKKLLGLAD
ncbi:hypothetical protein IGI41_002832 [Enterococcus sp. DIV0876]